MASLLESLDRFGFSQEEIELIETVQMSLDLHEEAYRPILRALANSLRSTRPYGEYHRSLSERYQDTFHRYTTERSSLIEPVIELLRYKPVTIQFSIGN